MSILKRLRYFLMFVCTLSWAESHADSLDMSEVLELVEAGEMLSLDEIIAHNPSISEARLLDVELQRDSTGRLIYEFELFQSTHRVVELEVDAATGRIIHEEFEE